MKSGEQNLDLDSHQSIFSSFSSVEVTAMSLFKRKKKKEKKAQDLSEDILQGEDDIITKALDVALSEDEPKTKAREAKSGVVDVQIRSSSSVSDRPSPISGMETSARMSDPTLRVTPIRKETTRVGPKTVQEMRQLPGGVAVRPEVNLILPTWIEKKYYWARPNPQKHPDLHQSWLEEWSNFLLKWAEATNSHVVSVPRLLTEFPFNNPVIKAKLLEPEIREICEYLIQKNLATWYDKNKRRLRIYWKSLDEFAEDLYDWAFLRGESFATLMDLAQAGQPWSNLPPKELQRLMELLVREGRAEWADEEKRTIQFLYE